MLNGVPAGSLAVPVVEEAASSPGPGFAQADVSPSGTLVYVRRKAAKGMLEWLDVTGRTQLLRAAAAEYVGTVRFSPDGNRLAVSVEEEGGNRDIWVYQWERDIMTRLTFAPGYDDHPVWTPDGKHIVSASAPRNLYWMRADAVGAPVRLTESKNAQFPASFSPDGSRLAFMERSPQTNWDLWTLPLKDVETDYPKMGKPEPFLITQFNEAWPVISPDGRWLAYQSDESGNDEIYVQTFPGPGGKWRVSTRGGDLPVWSKTGPELFYRSSEGMMVTTYTATGEVFVASKPRIW
jgi:Tol biopolymer transport system component